MVLTEAVLDAFDTLGLTPDTPEDIARSTYRKLALAHHPDRNRGDGAATERFQEIGAAWSLCQGYYEELARSHVRELAAARDRIQNARLRAEREADMRAKRQVEELRRQAEGRRLEQQRQEEERRLQERQRQVDMIHRLQREREAREQNAERIRREVEQRENIRAWQEEIKKQQKAAAERAQLKAREQRLRDEEARRVEEDKRWLEEAYRRELETAKREIERVRLELEKILQSAQEAKMDSTESELDEPATNHLPQHRSREGGSASESEEAPSYTHGSSSASRSSLILSSAASSLSIAFTLPPRGGGPSRFRSPLRNLHSTFGEDIWRKFKTGTTRRFSHIRDRLRPQSTRYDWDADSEFSSNS